MSRITIEEIKKEWHPTKNGNLRPEDVTAGSSKKVWWMCEKGHEWEAMVRSRTSGSKCPYCLGRKATKENCLETLNPYVAKEWHPTKNGDLTPKDVTAGSSKKVWWMCEKGHEWEAKIISRTGSKGGDKKGSGCPYCAGQKSCVDNSLEFMYPDIAKEWHPTKNGNLRPEDVTAGSSKKVWWMCEKGHEWEAKISSRKGSESTGGRKGRGCPYCAGRKVAEDNSLAVVCPESVKEWHPTKNGILTPNDVTQGADKVAWWMCDEGHEWEARVCDRYGKKKAGCPYCSGRKVAEDNSLAVVCPEIAKYWHPTKNGDLTPRDVTAGSSKKVWWVCDEGHEWEDNVYSRVNAKIKGCPYCAGRKTREERTLAVLRPDVAKYWHPTKNGILTPNDITVGSSEKVWWVCDEGHEWETKVSNRVVAKGTGCIICNRENRKKKK